MDFVSHGLWGSMLFGREQRRRDFWIAFFIGMAPDLFSFGPYTIGTWLGIFPHPDWSSGNHPSPDMIPSFVHTLYDFTHSLVIFAVVFLIVWLIRNRTVYLPLLAWGFHVLLDIPFHDAAFFPTPFLFPLSEYHVDGISWGHPFVFYPNAILLLGLYLWFFLWPRIRSKNHFFIDQKPKI